MTTDFQQKLMNYSIGGIVTIAVAFGEKLGLMKALADVSSEEKPATPAQVADKAKCKERYVKEWLSCMACADLIEVNDEEKFWIDSEKKKLLIDNPPVSLAMMSIVPILVQSSEKLQEAFSNSSRLGLEYSDFSAFYTVMESMTKAMHGETLIPLILPDIGHGISEKMSTGGVRTLDVGCGNGFHSILLAKNYPKSHFVGLDISESAIATANENKKKEGLANVEFVVCNAGEMPQDWSNTYDLVTIFDACHDQRRPDLCCKEIHRVLKKGGVFAMIEIRGTSNVAQDKASEGVSACLFYGCSMFHCLPVASNSPDALCLGAKWGVQRGRKLLNEAGFEQVDIKNPDYIPANCIYICKK